MSIPSMLLSFAIFTYNCATILSTSKGSTSVYCKGLWGVSWQEGYEAQSWWVSELRQLQVWDCRFIIELGFRACNWDRNFTASKLILFILPSSDSSPLLWQQPYQPQPLWNPQLLGTCAHSLTLSLAPTHMCSPPLVFQLLWCSWWLILYLSHQLDMHIVVLVLCL